MDSIDRLQVFNPNLSEVQNGETVFKVEQKCVSPCNLNL